MSVAPLWPEICGNPKTRIQWPRQPTYILTKCSSDDCEAIDCACVNRLMPAEVAGDSAEIAVVTNRPAVSAAKHGHSRGGTVDVGVEFVTRQGVSDSNSLIRFAPNRTEATEIGLSVTSASSCLSVFPGPIAAIDQRSILISATTRVLAVFRLSGTGWAALKHMSLCHGVFCFRNTTTTLKNYG